jgi:putative membrane protein
MMWGWGYPWMGTMMLWMGIFSVIWLVVLGLVVWALVRWVSGRSPTSGSTSAPSAIEILDQRYARGEIDTATYEEMRARLRASRESQGAERNR